MAGACSPGRGRCSWWSTPPLSRREKRDSPRTRSRVCIVCLLTNEHIPRRDVADGVRQEGVREASAKEKPLAGAGGVNTQRNRRTAASCSFPVATFPVHGRLGTGTVHAVKLLRNRWRLREAARRPELDTRREDSMSFPRVCQ